MSIATLRRFRYHHAISAFTCIFWLAYLAFTPTPTRQQSQAAAPNAVSAALLFDLQGADGPVSALAGEGDYVYAGGSFGTIGGVNARGVALTVDGVVANKVRINIK